METVFVFITFDPDQMKSVDTGSFRARQYSKFLHRLIQSPEMEEEISRMGITHAWCNSKVPNLHIGIQSMNSILTREQLRQIRGNFPGALRAVQFRLEHGVPENASIEGPVLFPEHDSVIRQFHTIASEEREVA